MRWKAYPKYKDSGVAWLGVVPKDWEIKRIGYLSKKINSGKTPLGGSETYVNEGVIFLRSQNVYDEGLFLDDVVYIDKSVDQEMANSRVKPKDILLNITGASIGRTCILPDNFPAANVNQHVCIVRLIDTEQSKYIAWVLKSATIKSQIMAAQAGAARDGLNFDQISRLIFAIPEQEEQTAIADFLDRETGCLDTLIAKKQVLIGLLKEKRTALISQTVTRGLPADAAREFGLEPHTRFKDSGVEWLKKIPEGWWCWRLRHLISEPLKYGANISTELDDPELPRYIRITDVNENGGLRDDTFRSLPMEVAASYLLKEGDLLFARSGATSGKTFLYQKSWGVCAYAGYLIRARLNHQRAIPAFIKYFTTSVNYWQWLSSIYIQATIQNVSAEKYADLQLPIPPIDEQTAIATYLDRETAKIDTLIAKVQAAMDRLQEYRTALITAAVTGKIDVRHHASKKEAA